MKFFAFFLMFLLVLIGDLFSQKIGIFYNTDEWVDFTFLKTVSSKIENEYKSSFNVIEYCTQALKKDFTEITVIDLNPSNMISIKGKVKSMCTERNLDYAIVLVHTPLHPDMAANKIRYTMGNKSFGLVVHAMNKKVYYVFFNTEFILYSKKLDNFPPINVEEYKTYEWFREKEDIVENGRLTERVLNDGILMIKQKLDLNLRTVITAIKING